ncbi:phage major capsid protein [Rickettsiales bacterium LUAb2]
MANPQTNQEILAAAVIEFLIDQPVINTLNNTPFLNALQKRGRINRREFAQAYQTYVSGQYGEAAFSDATGNITTDYKVDPLVAMFIKKTLPVIVNLNRDLVEFRGSKSVIIDQIRTKFSEASGAGISTTEASLYGSEADDNGTSLSGLTDAVSKTPTTGLYGGIDRATNTNWRNQAVQANGAAGPGLDPTIFDGTPTTANNIADRLSACISLLDYNGGYSDRFILVSSDYYQMLQQALNKNARNILDASNTLRWGANNLEIRGIEIINAGGIKFINGTNHPGIDTKTLYILSSDTVNFDYMNNQANWLTKVIKNSDAYKGKEIQLDNKLMLFSLPGIESSDPWWQKSRDNLNYSAQLTADMVFSLTNPALNLVMFDQ